jgi:hypothetical protein
MGERVCDALLPNRARLQGWIQVRLQVVVSHTWLQNLVLQFIADPSKMWRLQRAKGDPKFSDFTRAQKYSLQLKERGELRGGLHLSRRAKLAKFFESY